MGGLIVLIVFVLYLWVCIRITRWLLRICPWPATWPRWPRVALYPLMLALVFVLPVADELLARPKFNSLCEKGAVLKIDAQRIRGKTIRVEVDPSKRLLDGTIVPILHSHFRYLDSITGEELASYDTYDMRGGLLSRTLGFPEGSPAWTGDPSCVPSDWGGIHRRYGFTEIN